MLDGQEDKIGRISGTGGLDRKETSRSDRQAGQARKPGSRNSPGFDPSILRGI